MRQNRLKQQKIWWESSLLIVNIWRISDTLTCWVENQEAGSHQVPTENITRHRDQPPRYRCHTTKLTTCQQVTKRRVKNILQKSHCVLLSLLSSCRDPIDSLPVATNIWAVRAPGRKSEPNMWRLTWDPSGCCRWRASEPVSPREEEWGPTCCRETPRTSSTAACGMAPRSWRSLHAGRFRSHSGWLFSAGGRSRHRGRTGLGQERRDKTERSGDAHRSGGSGLEEDVGRDGEGANRATDKGKRMRTDWDVDKICQIHDKQ